MTNNIFNKKTTLYIFAVLAVLELISFLGYLQPLVSTIAFILIVAGTLVLTLKDKAYGFIILLLELLIGSQGYLLSLNIGGFRLSLRIALWTIVMIIWFSHELVPIIQYKKLSRELRSFPYWKPFGAFLVLLAFASLVGVLRGNDHQIIVIEAKRWIYCLALIPITLVFRTKETRQLLWNAILAASTWIAVKTALLVYIFLHGIYGNELIYFWLRRDLLGEVTLLSSGFSRVFLQSQVFAIPAFLFSLAFFTKYKKTLYGILASIFLATIITSLSRSFWLGALVGWACYALGAVIVLRKDVKALLGAAARNVAVAIAGFLLLFIAAEFPIPTPLVDIDTSLISNRATQFEAAAASRWSLLPVINKAIGEDPIIGAGLGKTLSYKTSDPRILESRPDGMYTTYAFEWGWHDIVLKLGIIGAAAYLYFLASLAFRLWKRFRDEPLYAATALGSLAALIVLHAFTPYLNHPLGFGLLGILMVAAEPLD